VYEALATSPDGLSSDEVAARLDLYGLNLLAEEADTPVWRKMLAHLAHPLSWTAMAGRIDRLSRSRTGAWDCDLEPGAGKHRIFILARTPD
jgi:hypothetical protein